MANRGFNRGQTQVLFRHLPEAIFEHDDYGLCKVTRVALGDVEVNREALFDAMADALAMWSTPGFAVKFPDPRDPGRRTYYAVGSPREVRFTPYPQTFTCRACTRTARFADLLRRGMAAAGRCTCGGTMKQLGPRPERFLKVVPTGDPSLYVPHTVAFINFPEDTEGMKAAPDAHGLMLARTWGLLDDTVGNTLRERESLGKGAADNQTLADMVEELRRLDPQNKLILEYDAKKSRLKGQDAIDRVGQLIARRKAVLSGAPRRWLIEHTTLLEKTNVNTTTDVAAMLRRRGDEAGALVRLAQGAGADGYKRDSSRQRLPAGALRVRLHSYVTRPRTHRHHAVPCG